jgi:hypothetical protein
MGKTHTHTHNYLKNVPCKRRWCLFVDSQNGLPIVTKDNNLLNSICKRVFKYTNKIIPCFECSF